MYYLIDNDSDLSFAQQIAVCDTFLWLDAAINSANRRSAQTGHSWEVVEIRNVYTVQAGEEASK